MKSRAAEFLADAADRSVRFEVMTTPKPGLVDAENSGCHKDMDYSLFIKSADAIAPFWVRQAEVGVEGTPPEEAMKYLRETGIAAEKAMSEATGGINTHKGLIYIMSLLLYGAGFVCSRGERLSPESIARAASLAVRGAVADELIPAARMKDLRPLTHGERLFVKYGITGVRGEAERGFPSVIKRGLPVFCAAADKGAAENDAGIAALLAIMLHCEDSNVIHRAGYEYMINTYPKIVS
ncbi:MAG: triphosphoribosyl-dephospho-CoA synthase, partial [Synergistes sp.]|nr:triphosphoribosyl-dephospho-CoA synthase [Synergistes sp.]